MTSIFRSWADETLEEEKEEEQGIKFRSEVRIDEKGRKFRVTQKIRVSSTTSLVNKRTEERKKTWKKFGRAGGEGVTYLGEEQSLVFINQEDEDERREVDELYQSLLRDGGLLTGSESAYYRAWRPTTKPSMRHFNENASNAETVTLKISNIPDECSEDDVRELVRDMGKVVRTRLVRDRKTNLSKGVAYVSFLYREEAERALSKLNRHSLNYSILSVEEVSTL